MDEFAEDVYREHGAAVLRLATRLCGGDRGLAEDVLQETVTRAWRHAAELRASNRPLRPWLFTVARRVVMNQARARRARPPEAGEAALDRVPAADPIDRLLTALAVREAARRLSPEHRRVLLAVCCLGAPIREVADAARVPAGTVKSRRHYALRAMRAALANEGGQVSWATS
jgi:RNA polymerase sigma-70 factor (ECF subfamily)